MRGSLFQIIIFIGLTASWEEKSFHNDVDLCYMYDKYTWQRRSLFIRDKPILSSEMSHKDYDCKGSVDKKKTLVVVGLGTKT
jgi:hypothetical protein